MSEEKKIESYSCCGSNSAEKEEIFQKEQDISSDLKVKKLVREQYSAIATGSTSLDEGEINTSGEDGYTDYSSEDLQNVPKGANLGLGSGNPIGLSAIQPGEVILDLGSGGGIDCFLAAQKTGESGKIIGVDMTPEMIDRARANARREGYKNVEFRLGEIEHLPVADNSVDLVISNCVINLAVDKAQVFKEVFRVLKPGGRAVVSDIVLQEEFPEVIQRALDGVPGCVSRAWVTEDYLGVIEAAGLERVELLESQVIKPRKQARPVENKSGKLKRQLQVYGKKIEVELTPEEDEKLSNLVMKGHIRAFKPN